MSKCQNVNELSLKLLEKLGNRRPHQDQIKLVESLLLKINIEYQLYFNKRLTQQERSCLLLAAKGKTTKEAAQLLSISVSTVKEYHKNIKYKLASTTIAQAVFEGIHYGYLLQSKKINY